MESGSTTTPFDMLVRNQTSRWHLVMETFNTLAARGVIEHHRAEQIVEKYSNKLTEHRKYIRDFGQDPEEIQTWQWNRGQ